MDFTYKEFLPQKFADDSRVWVYQVNRLFSLGEALEIENILKRFTAGWLSHGVPVKGFGTLLFGQFIILMADEEATGVSGCSTDSSVRLIKEIEKQFSVSLFNRTTLAFVVKENIQLLSLSQLPYALENEFISGDTQYFNNLVQTKKELEENWIIPVKDSWLAKKIVPLPSASYDTDL
jgi:hypothetical protein